MLRVLGKMSFFRVVPLTNARRALILKSSKLELLLFSVCICEKQCNFLKQCFDQSFTFDGERRTNVTGDRSFAEMRNDDRDQLIQRLSFPQQHTKTHNISITRLRQI